MMINAYLYIFASKRLQEIRRYNTMTVRITLLNGYLQHRYKYIYVVRFVMNN